MAVLLLPLAGHAMAQAGMVAMQGLGPGIANSSDSQAGAAGTMLNGTRMVTDSKTCLASVDRCVMVKMMHLPPMIQMETGLGALDVSCNAGLQLVLKASDASPACVTPPAAAKLVTWGWALGQDRMDKIRAQFEPAGQ